MANLGDFGNFQKVVNTLSDKLSKTKFECEINHGVETYRNLLNTTYTLQGCHSKNLVKVELELIHGFVPIKFSEKPTPILYTPSNEVLRQRISFYPYGGKLSLSTLDNKGFNFLTRFNDYGYIVGLGSNPKVPKKYEERAEKVLKRNALVTEAVVLAFDMYVAKRAFKL